MCEVKRKLEQIKEECGVVLYKGDVFFFGQQVCRYLGLVARSGGRSAGFNGFYQRLDPDDRIRMPGYDPDDTPKLSPVLLTEQGVRRLIAIAEKRHDRSRATPRRCPISSPAILSGS